MSEVNLIMLRRLRERARALLRTTSADLRPFAKADGTFRRKPDSPSIDDDINVTTTCSCVMALAGTDNFRDFYKKQPTNDADSIFKTIVDAPWMSSGLTANNAFTTTLVIRTFGFLVEEDLFKTRSGDDGPIQNSAIKKWELHLGIKNVISLAKKIKEHSDPASEFLWLSLSDKTREDLTQKLSGEPALGKAEKELRAILALDMRRIIQSGWIYDEKKFTRASTKTKELLAEKPTGYKMAAVNHQLLVDQYPDEFDVPASRSLTEIAVLMAGDADNFSINEYPPSTAVVYWFVDGVERGQINLGSDQWTVLCNWAAKEFNHERSLVVAEHDAVMDPVAMGMSACLCARLRTISEETKLGTKKEHAASLPSNVELERSIEELLLKQTKSGIFPKYFPMFHYQDAGSNFCFTFELLEAVLHEFGHDENKLLARPEVIRALETAITWCENNRYGETTQYAGWNSGGDLKTVRKEQPESWATAVVHMFLSELTTVISRRIQRHILRKYKARDPKPRESSTQAGSTHTQTPALDELLDIEIVLQGKAESLKDELRFRIIENYKSQNEATLRRKPIKKPLSALLFGPPGTSKTEVTKAVADDLNWPTIEITPSDFLTGTLANIYLTADEIFDDLMDLAGVVVFFDEMDALVQTREGEVHLDIASQFLTTTMLPKLTRLHDQAQVVFFMATNFQDRFDAAIKRAGRFDLLLCMGPPKLSEKLNRLHRVYLMDAANEHTKKAGEAISNHLKDKPALQDQLALYTFGEYKAFLRTVADAETVEDAISTLDDALSKIEPAKFQEQLNDYSQFVTLKLPELEPLRKILTWTDLADLEKKKFTLKDIEKENAEKENIPITHIVRYFCDRQQSKEQF